MSHCPELLKVYDLRWTIHFYQHCRDQRCSSSTPVYMCEILQ